MKKVNLILKISLFSFFIFVFIAIYFFIYKENKNKIIYETKNVEYDTISYIDISVLDFDVNIVSHSSEKTRIEYFSDVELEIDNQKNVLNISQKSRISVPVLLLDEKQKQLNVFLPKSQYSYIRVINSAGNTHVSDISADNFDCSAKNGDISLKNISGNTTIVTSAGKISGSILDFNELVINTNDGQADLAIPENEHFNLNFSLNRGVLSAFFLDKNIARGEHISFYSDDSKDIKVTTRKGNITLSPIK